MTAIARVTKDPGILAIPSAIISATALTLPEDADLSLEAALALLTQVGTVKEASCYWRGDLYLWIERRYGRDALSQALSDMDYNDIRPYIWVSERVPPDVRDVRLSWSHHRIVSAIKSHDDQLEWLAKAADNGWTVAQLREAIKGPTTRRKLDREQVLELSHDRIGLVWTEEDDMALRAALGVVEA